MADDIKTGTQEQETNDTQESTVEKGEETSKEKETSQDAEDSDVETETDDLDAEKLEVAKQLYKALQDPNKSKTVVRNLAKNLGIELGSRSERPKDETKATDKETGKTVSIKTLVDKHLPPNFKIMAPFMTAMLEEYQASFVESKFQESTSKTHEERSNVAGEWLQGKYKDVGQFEDKMYEIAQEMPPGRLNSQKDFNRYLERIYFLAKGSSGDTADFNGKLLRSIDKSIKNAKRAKPGPSDVDRVKVDGTAQTTREAVEMAMKQLNRAAK